MRALGKWQGVALVDVAGGRRERRTRTPNPPGAGADALSDADCLLPMRAASYRYTFTGEPNKDNTGYEPKPSCFAVVSQVKSSKSCQADISCGSNRKRQILCGTGRLGKTGSASVQQPRGLNPRVS